MIQFDYLKSLEIEKKINHIRWCHTANGAMFLLSTNDKTIKCWKVQEKKIKKVCNMNTELPKSTSNGFVTSSNVPTISKIHTANGGGIDKHSSSFPLGKISSLHLLMVVVPIAIIYH